MLSLHEFLLKEKKTLEFNSYCISMLTWIGSSKTASFNMKVRIRGFQKILRTGFFNPIRFNSLFFSKLLVFTSSVQNKISIFSHHILLCVFKC